MLNLGQRTGSHCLNYTTYEERERLGVFYGHVEGMKSS